MMNLDYYHFQLSPKRLAELVVLAGRIEERKKSTKAFVYFTGT